MLCASSHHLQSVDQTSNMATEGSEQPHTGAWPAVTANSFRQDFLQPADSSSPHHVVENEGNSVVAGNVDSHSNVSVNPNGDGSGNAHTHEASPAASNLSAEQTAVPSPAESPPAVSQSANVAEQPEALHSEESLVPEKAVEAGQFEAIRTAPTNEHRPKAASMTTTRRTEDQMLFKALSRGRTNTSFRQGSIATSGSTEEDEQQAEIRRLMSRMFGKDRQANSEDEKTRHVGVIFKSLSVTGMGLGAALQPTLGDIFLGLPRLVQGLLFNAKRTTKKPPIRTLLNNFTGCIKPGEMLLVLGRPGSGCSTFLKVLANQRFGFVGVDGEVTYGGTDAATMAKNYRGEVLYNPEDDLHYATLSVKNTLSFALKTRTPGKASRNEGESRNDYVREFLRVVAKLFWIEHTMGTKVGNEHVRGVSGGEKKRVSIAEAMITKASTQCWDNSTRGLDASTALEYVEALRSLTTMAHISTSVALYQAGESLYDLFDKVILIDEGKCLYYGPSDKAAAYFEDLGFTRPARWTTADFVSLRDFHIRGAKSY